MVELGLREMSGDSPEKLPMLCPVCQAAPVEAVAWETNERLVLFHLIPIGPVHSNTWVKCPQCRQTFLSGVGLEELLALKPGEVTSVLKLRASLPAQFLAVASVALGWIPIVGLGLGVLATAMNWKSHSWTRKVSLIGLTLGLLSTVAIFGLRYLEHHPRGRNFR